MIVDSAAGADNSPKTTQISDVTVVIVTWNCRAYAEQCLRSLMADQSVHPLRTIVIDNRSGDGTVELIRSRFPEVTVVANDGNVGFAAANNQAMLSTEGAYILLLNPDTKASPRAVDAMADFLDADDSLWAVGPTIANADGTLQRSGVRFPGNWTILCETLFLDRLFPHSRLFGSHTERYMDPSIPRAVDYVQGSCLMVRREGIRHIGMLDEEFFMYFEETDWCFRMKRAGGNVYYVPTDPVVHFGGGEFGHYDERRLVHYHESLLRFYRKHYHILNGLILRAILLVRSAIRLAVWGAVWLMVHHRRTAALSSIKGYLRVMGILWTYRARMEASST
jgi:N-acetylglucosaminyl-diphospho-decaprenol L-rhamnosyltransferase